MPLIFSPLHNLTKFISFLFFFIEDVLVILSLIYIKYVIKIIFSPGVRLRYSKKEDTQDIHE